MLALVWCLGPVALADDVDDVKQFFEAHVALEQAFDATAASHFADDAVISVLRDGERMEVNGAQWKAMAPKVMALAKQRGDAASYANVSVAAEGSGFRILAERTSSIKCATGAYSMDVVKGEGTWAVVAEHGEAVSLSLCKPSKKLASALKTMRSGLLPHLPLDLDAETRLEKVEVVNGTLIYDQRLHAYAREDLDLASTLPALHQLGLQNVCGTPEMMALVKQGATVRYLYRDKAGEELTKVDVFDGVCP